MMVIFPLLQKKAYLSNTEVRVRVHTRVCATSKTMLNSTVLTRKKYRLICFCLFLSFMMISMTLNHLNIAACCCCCRQAHAVFSLASINSSSVRTSTSQYLLNTNNHKNLI